MTALGQDPLGALIEKARSSVVLASSTPEPSPLVFLTTPRGEIIVDTAAGQGFIGPASLSKLDERLASL
eukprot:189035-Pyramimonas_sp.AAC.1